MSLSNLKMPENVVLDEQSFSNTYGKFTLQPLERGYGVTLGNSLRRVLLSSLTGAAIVAVKFSDVLHEFTTIPGVVEDVTEMILNLKQVRLKLKDKKTPGKIDLTFNGEGEFTAADIQKKSNEIEVMNPELHIATLNKNAKFSLELRIGKGRGYVPSIENKSPEYPIGTIAIDSIFTPIKNVKYEIENVRIGDKNDYEKLTLEIFTDGTILPDEALTQSAKILREHLQLFINLDKEPEEKLVEQKKDTEKERIKKILLINVDDLELSVRAHNCLKAASIKTISDLVRRDESEMLKFRNFGRKSLAELTEIIEGFGLEFGMDVDKYLKDENENN